MIVGLQFDTKEFERAIAALVRESDRADSEIITMNAKTFLKAVVYNTPRDTGTTRAGYYPAWMALGMPGTPGTNRGYAPWAKKGGRLYTPEGRVVDERHNSGMRSFEFANSTFYRANGKKVYYPYILNARRDFFGKGAAEASFKFGKLYERLLKKHGKL